MKQTIKILIIGVNLESREIYQHFFEKNYQGILEVQEVKTAHEGLAQYQLFCPDCILLDENLPDMPCLDFINQVRKNKNFLQLPIIILTEQGASKLSMMASQESVFDSLIKQDLTPKVLERIIHYAVERYRLLQEVEISNKKLLQEQAEKRLLLNVTSEGIISLDKNKKISFINTSAKKILGINDEDIAEGYLEDLLKDIDQKNKIAEKISIKDSQLSNAIQNSNLITFRFKLKDGKQILIEYNIFSLYDEYQEYVALVIVFQDAAVRTSVERELAYKASYDRLTGLLNRFIFEELLIRALALAKRHETKPALLFLDIDYFKQINDRYGHDVGDLLLKEVASRLRKVLRSSDIITRLGGDEFAVLIEGGTTPDYAAKAAEKILSVMREKLVLNGHELYIRSSIGIAVFPMGGDDAASLLKNADTAMYKAKESGRDCFRFYSKKVNEAVFQIMEFERELHQALQENQYILNFQPIIDLKNGNTVGIETLLRWNHPVKGILTPDKFLPKAEEYHLTIDIGKWLIEVICQNYLLWREQEIITDEVFIAINISSVQLTYEDFIDHMLQVIKKYHVPYNRIELEISEKSFFENVKSALRSLDKLRSLGSSVAIDNYGMGMSSLKQLKSLPVSALKIDKTFIHGMMDNQNDAAVVRAMIEIAHGMKVKVIAEGVETKAQALRLQEYQCDMAQGYYFCHPLPSDELVKYLRSPNNRKMT